MKWGKLITYMLANALKQPPSNVKIYTSRVISNIVKEFIKKKIYIVKEKNKIIEETIYIYIFFLIRFLKVLIKYYR